ncbi:hypothetical protein [Paenarthrobacter sp. YIM B13468]|uniref:hypothetical protein n=1 Tax=Paenarthrobacter sp. YIM B13468 TaxID=3366295 RepID=UPI00366CFBB3
MDRQEKTPRAVSGTVGALMVTIPKTFPPSSTVGEVRSLFADDHVLIASVVAANGELLTTIERSDIPAEAPDESPAVHLGRLEGRTALEYCSINRTTGWLKHQGRRRLAVVDAGGHLLGLLCLKRSGRGYCSDAGVLGRQQESDEQRAVGSARCA